nr:VanZ family protein [uncultured Flavobacterium sp.]
MLKKSILSLAIGWTFLIAVLCLYRFGDLPKIKVSGIDKYVHFTFHFVFTLLWGYYVWLQPYRFALKKLFIIVLISLCYGILIEFLQEIFTQTRHADIMDVLANFTGAMTALLLFIWLKKEKKV